MESQDKVLIMCEIDQSEAIAFLEKCESEGMTFSEKVVQLIQNFLPIGDNHLLKTSA